MSKEKVDNLFTILGRIRIRINYIREERDANLLLIEVVLIQIKKINLLRVNPRGRTLLGYFYHLGEKI
jgi:hypothetical protein